MKAECRVFHCFCWFGVRFSFQKVVLVYLIIVSVCLSCVLLFLCVIRDVMCLGLDPKMKLKEYWKLFMI